jgi:hypothetical protein
MDVAGSENASLQVAELVEHKQRMIAGAAKVAIANAIQYRNQIRLQFKPQSDFLH